MLMPHIPPPRLIARRRSRCWKCDGRMTKRDTYWLCAACRHTVTYPSLPAVGTLFTREHVDTRPCPTCAEPIADTNRGPVHWEVLPNGAKTAYDKCRTGDQCALFRLT